MSKHLFLISGVQGRWHDAFADDARTVEQLSDALQHSAEDSLVWVDLARQQDIAELRRQRPQLRLIGMSVSPSQQEAMAAFSAGVRGYCHALAVPEQLKQVALVVSNGGLWIGADLMERAVNAVGQVVASQPADDPAHRGVLMQKLSPRERDVALQVAGGASNKVVARQLDITERTVKAHLTSIFEKLGVNDRLQLVIALRRGTEARSTVH